MKKLILALLCLLFTSGYSVYKFSHPGAVVTYSINTNRLCIGSTYKSDILTYYYFGSFGTGNTVTISEENNDAIDLSYPNNCLKITLKPELKYVVLYIQNQKHYSYRFKTAPDGTITKLKPGE